MHINYALLQFFTFDLHLLPGTLYIECHALACTFQVEVDQKFTVIAGSRCIEIYFGDISDFNLVANLPLQNIIIILNPHACSEAKSCCSVSEHKHFEETLSTNNYNRVCINPKLNNHTKHKYRYLLSLIV